MVMGSARPRAVTTIFVIQRVELLTHLQQVHRRQQFPHQQLVSVQLLPQLLALLRLLQVSQRYRLVNQSQEEQQEEECDTLAQIFGILFSSLKYHGGESRDTTTTTMTDI